jgi:hypothetical protein
LTRFTVHSAVYWGNDLRYANDSAARGYLQKLQDSGIKPSIENAYNLMESEFSNYYHDLSTDFAYFGDVVKVSYYKNDVLIGDTTTLSDDEIMTLFVEDVYLPIFSHNLGPILVSLMNLEMQLEAYKL